MKPRYRKKNPKKQQLNIRLTPSDKNQLNQNAKHTGLSLSEYLIICALRRQLPFTDADTQRTLICIRYSLVQVANNFEQLTKTCHLNPKLGEPVVVDNDLLMKLEHTLKEVQQMMTFFEQINFDLTESAL